MKVTASSTAAQMRAWGEVEAAKEYPDDTYKATLAVEALVAGHEFLKAMPPELKFGRPEKVVRAEVKKHIRARLNEVRDNMLDRMNFLERCTVLILGIILWPLTVTVVMTWAILRLFGFHFDCD